MGIVICIYVYRIINTVFLDVSTGVKQCHKPPPQNTINTRYKPCPHGWLLSFYPHYVVMLFVFRKLHIYIYICVCVFWYLPPNHPAGLDHDLALKPIWYIDICKYRDRERSGILINSAMLLIVMCIVDVRRHL